MNHLKMKGNILCGFLLMNLGLRMILTLSLVSFWRVGFQTLHDQCCGGMNLTFFGSSNNSGPVSLVTGQLWKTLHRAKHLALLKPPNLVPHVVI